jgi:hypothetical protein
VRSLENHSSFIAPLLKLSGVVYNIATAQIQTVSSGNYQQPPPYHIYLGLSTSQDSRMTETYISDEAATMMESSASFEVESNIFTSTSSRNETAAQSADESNDSAQSTPSTNAQGMEEFLKTNALALAPTYS